MDINRNQFLKSIAAACVALKPGVPRFGIPKKEEETTRDIINRAKYISFRYSDHEESKFYTFSNNQDTVIFPEKSGTVEAVFLSDKNKKHILAFCATDILSETFLTDVDAIIFPSSISITVPAI